MVWLTRGFVIAFIVVFIIFYAVIYASSVVAFNNSFTPAGATTANQTYQNIVGIRQTATLQSIFLNNFEVSIALIIPLLGLLFFGLVMWNTGSTVGQLAYATGFTPLAYLIGITIPIGLIETTAYTVLGAEATYLAYLYFTKKDTKTRLTHEAWKSLILYLIILASAAALESTLIA